MQLSKDCKTDTQIARNCFEKDFDWYRVDARGNKQVVNAEFSKRGIKSMLLKGIERGEYLS